MQDRLSPLVFLPPVAGRPWTGAVRTSHEACLRENDSASRIAVPLPLFWSNPPWHLLTANAADAVAGAVADIGVTVSALLRDLSSEDYPSAFHGSGQESSPLKLPAEFSALKSTNSKPPSEVKLGNRHRLAPYRPQRYGLLSADFEHVSVVDLQLTVPRDDDGRFAFSAEQIQRWEATAPDAPLAGGGWVPAASFPPDVPSLDQLTIKINQLRALSPDAAVMVSLFPHRLDVELPAVLAQNPDGIILRCVDPNLPSVALPQIARRARTWMKHHHVDKMPLWLDAPNISPSDAVKLIEFGATGISIDAWCEPMLEHLRTTMQLGVTAKTGYSQIRPVSESLIADVVRHMLQPFVDEFKGMAESIEGLPADARFAATDPEWAAPLGVPLLSFGIGSKQSQ